MSQPQNARRDFPVLQFSNLLCFTALVLISEALQWLLIGAGSDSNHCLFQGNSGQPKEPNSDSNHCLFQGTAPKSTQKGSFVIFKSALFYSIFLDL